MDFPLYKEHVQTAFPALTEIPDAPEHVWMRGLLPAKNAKCLTVVGSRHYTNYGKQAVEYLIGGLRGYSVAVISGLALGIDSLAHRTALNAELYTLAVPGSGIDDTAIYPRTNRGLARDILNSGGGMLSEFEPTFTATPWSFPKRNRIMVGLSHAVLLIEAGEKSGTLITARLTAEYNRDLLAVPGNIFSDNSRGVHQFLKLGATPVTTPEDILLALNIERETNVPTQTALFTEEELSILTILTEPKDHDSLIRSLPYPPKDTLTLLMRMELAGYIHEQNGMFYKVK